MTAGNDDLKRSGLERKTKALFDDSVAVTDGSTRSRLTQARHRALAELETSAGRGWRRRWLPAGAVAAAMLVALMLARFPDRDVDLETAVATDLEILLDAEDLDLIEELEFYAWLDEQPELDEVPSNGNGVG